MPRRVTHRLLRAGAPGGGRERDLVERRRVRRLGVALLLLLPLHWLGAQWLIAQGAEPWPIISLPGFGSTTDADPIVVERPVFVAADARCHVQRVDIDRVLAGLPGSLRQGVMRTHFRPRPDGSYSGARPSSAAWLRGRVGAVIGGAPAYLAVQWERVELSAGGEELRRSPVRTVVVSDDDHVAGCGHGV